MDGKHIEFCPPISEGSFYHNYKGSDSIVLLGLVDANYKFIYVNLGVNGRISDGGVFSGCTLSKKIQNNSIGFPEPRYLPNGTMKVPYVIVADDAFPLSKNIMKPYPHRGLSYDQRVFNYRLSRARRMVECAFGILANRWRILLNKIHLNPKKVEIITLTCVLLHNFLIMESSGYKESDISSKSLHQVNQQKTGNHSKTIAREIRDEFKNYFCSQYGSVPWQHSAIEKGN